MATGERVKAEDEFEVLRDVAQQLMAAIAAEPVPDHLRALAVALGQALDRQQDAQAAADGDEG